MPLPPPSPDTASSAHEVAEDRSLATRATKSIASDDGAGRTSSLSGSIHRPQARFPQAPPTPQELAAAKKKLADELAVPGENSDLIMLAEAALSDLEDRQAKAAGPGGA